MIFRLYKCQWGCRYSIIKQKGLAGTYTINHKAKSRQDGTVKHILISPPYQATHYWLEYTLRRKSKLSPLKPIYFNGRSKRVLKSLLWKWLKSLWPSCLFISDLGWSSGATGAQPSNWKCQAFFKKIPSKSKHNCFPVPYTYYMMKPLLLYQSARMIVGQKS